MSTVMRTVPFGPEMQDHATLLLGAAEDLEMDPAVVRTTSNGFVVPQEVLEKSGLSDQAVALPDDEDAPEPAEVPNGNSEPAPAKKAAAKKAPAKKTAKKTAQPASKE